MMDFAAESLAKGDLVLLDSGPLIYLAEGLQAGGAGTRRAAVVRGFMEAAREAGIGLVASTLVWTELLRGPLAGGDPDLAAACRRLLVQDLQLRLEAVDVAIAEEAASLMSGRAGLSLADAFHIGTAIVLGAEAVLTNDEAWRAVLAEPAPPGRASGAGLGHARPAKKGRGLPRVLLVDELAFDGDAAL